MRQIPASLQAHFDGDVNTTCLLLRIVKNTGHAGAAEVVGFAELDVDVTYNDGSGDVLYASAAAFNSSAIENTGDLSVDNAETSVLIPADNVGPITIAEINAGRFDTADFRLYRVNWRDLSMGHELVAFGTIGRAAMVLGGLAVQFELRGQSQQMKQSIVYRDTRTCPARFGSQQGDERLWCGFNVASLLVGGAVTSVGVENTRTFTDTALAQAAGFFVPGLVFWLTGPNAGTAQEVESFASGVLSLRFDAPFPITAGDTFNVRRDCNKQARDADKGCKHFFAAQWPLHFRGTPDIPTGDANAIASPGATVPPSNGLPIIA